MTAALETQLRDVLGESPLAEHLPARAALLLERRGADACVRTLDGPARLGLARAVASSAEAARYLARRPELLAQIAGLSADSFARRGAALLARATPQAGDLEDFLDTLRLLRRDEMLLACCAQLGEIVPLAQVSLHLSLVAETCVRQALAAAESRARSRLSVIGMSKIAGRELSYHSDLDVIFLYPDEVEDVLRPSRSAQRVISYLTTMTGAGIAYAVDSRLRPSGRQGALVSTFSAYRRYQTRRAALWEHLALMRARAIAGETDTAQALLDGTRQALLQDSWAKRGQSWEQIAALRARVEGERGATGRGERIAFKTGAGGLMDVEFLATGLMLETRAALTGDTLPAIPTLLGRLGGARVEQLLSGYEFLRRVEACARWVAGRPVEDLDLAAESAAIVSELVQPGLDTAGLALRLREVCAHNRAAFAAVVERGSVRALADPG